MMIRRAIVTGASGFIGQKLVRQLIARRVRVLTVGTGGAANEGAQHLDFGPAIWTEPQWRQAIETGDPDVIFHLAGRFRGSFAELEAANIGQLQTLLASLSAYETKPALVVAGSAAEYGTAFLDGEPTCESVVCTPASQSYGATKHAQTRAAMAFAEKTGARIIIARIFNAVGAGMPKSLALGDFAAQIAAMGAGGVIRTGNLDVWRDFLDVETVAQTMVRLAEVSAADGIINVCSGVAAHLRTIVEHMIERSRKTIRLELDASRIRPGETRVIIGSTARLQRLGIAPQPPDMQAIADAILTQASSRVAA
jgi:GDP-4-dehydro-6-deoxy-D-mannose reductase